MDWKRLFKAIGIALFCVLLIAIVLMWIILGRNDWRWFVGGLFLIAFSCFVAYIYNKID